MILHALALDKAKRICKRQDKQVCRENLNYVYLHGNIGNRTRGNATKPNQRRDVGASRAEALLGSFQGRLCAILSRVS
jgi:hypothetical protein